ncbi:class IIb bacteriocin, lactobin A/cerein 7B family [Xylocopilactobacillus apicola]|uniref:Class IIb bacteriocin, lactobin A/cerein 7B family n=1 Tax=Xylocopilactobacillus apicola TaxID=2932184 RepID=A0AAU9CUS3_9LACO|nr:class IIb bacteriocin, lactobin A/cerein 7B family [Xylocopilactobacillus apicola]BDR57742.1 hypothetical protein XA3_01830 [Xylocopilactobacillus apicola]
MKQDDKLVKLNKFQSMSNDELSNTNGGIAPALFCSLFVIGYRIGADIAKKRHRKG